MHQLLEAAHFRAAELVDLTIVGAALDRSNDRARDIAGEDRLEPGMPAADERQRGGKAGDRRELVEEVVFGPEQNRGPQDDGRGTAASTSLSPTAFERA